MIFTKILLMSLVSLTATDLRVLFFTMDSCPPCQQTKPGIERLEREGVAVSKIDVRQYQQYAAQCQVTQTPTVIIADGNTVVARHTGAMNYADLKNMLNSVPRNESQIADRKNARATNQPSNSNADNSRTNSAASTQETDSDAQQTAEQRAWRATVRFRVEDDHGTGYATGTIVHRANGEALVLTCGHVFRDSNGKGKINADIGFFADKPTTVQGTLIFYDAAEHDIALVAIPCPLDIQPVPVAPEALAVQTGDKVFSFGCDKGDDPSLRPTVLKAVTRYSSVAKYDIVGRPIDGRSGGGLFSAGGQLIGVCNAAAVEVDEGIYTGLESVYWQFAKTNLTHLFRKTGTPTQLSFDERQLASRSRPAQAEPAEMRMVPASAGLNERGQTQNAVARGNELNPSVVQAIHRGSEIPVNPAIYRGNSVPIRQASATSQAAVGMPPQPTNDNQLEVIVLVRSKTDPSVSKTITISDPDQETLQWIGHLEQTNSRERSASERAMYNQIARLPVLQRPGQGQESQMRAQSPR